MAEEEEEFEGEGARKEKVQKMLRAAYIEEKKREILGKFLEAKAYERIMNIKQVNPTLYDKVVEIIVQLVGSGRLSRKVSETELVALLTKLTDRREPTIEIRRK